MFQQVFRVSVLLSTCFVFLLVETRTCVAEFQVNTYTAGHQYEPAVAMDAVGNFVAVWTSYWQDGDYGDYGGIYGQRFDSVGNRLGSEFRINVTTERNQKTPDIAMDSSGNFVVTWASTMTDGYEDIYARRYNSSGIPLTGEFLVNSYTDLRQFKPKVSMNDSGRFIVVYESWDGVDNHNGEWHVKGRLYDEAGVPRGGDIMLAEERNGHVYAHCHKPNVAMGNSGKFVATWALSGAGGHLPSGTTILYAKFDEDGNSYGNFYDIHQLSGTVGRGSGAVNSSVGVDGNGNYVMAWTSADVHWPYFIGNKDIHAKLFLSQGRAPQDEFAVHADPDHTHRDCSVVMNDQGQFGTVWTSYTDLDVDSEIEVSFFDTDGTPLGDCFRANTYTDGRVYQPDISISDNGRYVIVWTSDGQDEDGYGVFAHIGTVPEPTSLSLLLLGGITLLFSFMQRHTKRHGC